MLCEELSVHGCREQDSVRDKEGTVMLSAEKGASKRKVVTLS